MRNLIGLLVLLATAILLASPAASAQSCVARPGLSALEQYCESVPAPSGNRPNKTGDASDARRKRETGGARPSPGARRSSQALEQAGGADEEDLNRFLNAPDNQTSASTTRPKVAPRTGGRPNRSERGAQSGNTAARAPIERSGTPPADVAGVASAVGASSSSATKLLAAVAVLALLAGLSVLLVRRRRGRIG